MKIVIIGAGSQIFGSRTVIDILLEEHFKHIDLELVLVDIHMGKLQQMHEFSRLVANTIHSNVTISATTKRDEALVGADYVFIAVSFDRYELWEQDFRVPYAYGFKQAYAENGGPGALFHALRNIHIIMGICDDITSYCPDALVFNFSNPESRVLLAMHELTSLNVIGLCHGQNDALQAVCSMLNRPQSSIQMRGGGINHFFWIQEMLDSETKVDLYPLFKEIAKQNTDPQFALTKKLLEVYGMLTYPDSTHAGEFMSCGYEYMNGKWVHGLESRSITSKHKSSINMLSPYLHNEEDIQQILKKSREIAIPIIVSIMNDTKSYFPSGNVVNSEYYIPNLNCDAIVEVPILVDKDGIHPQSIPALPEGVASMCRTQMSIQKLTVQAYKEKSKNLLLQALLLEPTVDSIEKAEALIEDMLLLQKDYLPQFK